MFYSLNIFFVFLPYAEDVCVRNCGRDLHAVTKEINVSGNYDVCSLSEDFRLFIACISTE
jgi:hypothetical protein